MPEPIVFISHFRIKEGGLAPYRDLATEIEPKIKAEKPGTLVFLHFLSEPGDRVTGVHVFGDTEAMDRHFEGAAERGAAVMEFLEPAGWDIYGTPSPAVMTTMLGIAEKAGVPLTVEPQFLMGFLRLQAS